MRPRENESWPRPVNDWPNPPYANRPEGNKGNFNDNVQLDTSQVQADPSYRPLPFVGANSGRRSAYSRAVAIRNRARRKK